MPSPLAHVAVGTAIYSISRLHYCRAAGRRAGLFPDLLLVAIGFSLLPDMDSVVGILTGNFGRFHNNATHSLIVGFVAALLFAAIWAWWKGNRVFQLWFVVALLSYELHVLMDAATISRGVMALWPLSSERYLAPVTLFYGLHWSDGWLSWRHAWTVVTELGFVVFLWFTLHFASMRRGRGRRE